MKKKVGIIKRVLCIGLIFLLSINSFAAIVSDNDGSAFITKAEFDALKSSFQSQIDSYNRSIDSKIDGAIASYLAGIQIAKTQMINTLDDYSGGARSIVADEWTLGTAGSYKPGGMNWTHGTMGLNLKSLLTEVVTKGIKTSDTTSTNDFALWQTKLDATPTNFKERLTQRYDTISGQASWYGYGTTKQKIEGSVSQIQEVDEVSHWPVAFTDNTYTTVVGDGSETSPYELRWNCWFQTAWDVGDNLSTKFALPVASDRISITEKTEPILGWGIWRWGNSNAGSADGWTNLTATYSYNYSTTGGVDNKELNATPTGLSFERTIDSVDNKFIILCDNDTEYPVHRLSDIDLISGWTNDIDPAFSTGISTGKTISNFVNSRSIQWVGSPRPYRYVNRNILNAEHGTVFKAYKSDTDTDYTYYKWVIRIIDGSKSGQLQEYPKASKPYFGFMNEIDDWRKISDGNYGSLVNPTDIKNAQKESASSTFLNHDGTELMIGAGLPVIKLDKDKEYTFTMKADTGSAPNETGDYYIWFKDGTFTDGKKPQNEANLFEVTGISKDATGYILPKGTTKEVTLKATRDGYLFCKWRCKALNGGGILYIDKNVTCTTLN